MASKESSAVIPDTVIVSQSVSRSYAFPGPMISEYQGPSISLKELDIFSPWLVTQALCRQQVRRTKIIGEAIADRKLESRQRFSTNLPCCSKNLPLNKFPRIFKTLRNHKTSVRLGSTQLTAEFKQFPKPCPKVHLEISVEWEAPKNRLDIVLYIKSVEREDNFTRFCLQAYVLKGDLNDKTWITGVYFGERNKLLLMPDQPMVVWSWTVNPTSLNIRNPDKVPVGNLKEFLVGETLNFQFDLIAMAIYDVIGCVASDFMQPIQYTEIISSEYRSLLQTCFVECGNYHYYSCIIYAGDRKSYFLCPKYLLMRNSSVIRKTIQENEKDDQHSDENLLTVLLIDNATTWSIRFILDYIYGGSIYPGWIRCTVETLATCMNLKMMELARKLVADLRKNHGFGKEMMNLLWDAVYQYQRYRDNKIYADRKVEHEILHPGEPCDDDCRNATAHWHTVSVLHGSGLKRL